jgi:type I restriction enzyme M protein
VTGVGYLPYRDPETLKAFLKIIDEFSYDHSERLGDAFEYLLSVLGSQGDAGQFRTPRHIIDFMVEVLAPKKGDVILDPACGTAGFLISAYKHILRSNTDALGQSTLTPEDRERLAKNVQGYDISPDMVRLSLVNLYLHGFSDPHIVEYDTLTSEERWNEFADVILANPPFMSPKGGIKPHKRFSIQAKRSEVLFVDYMAEHLTPTGRAGIIVPEGIIFQSQTAYRDLRRMLVESSLVAVISLPAGCFNPYSGVKTSILILDKSLARQSDTIAFFKVENDGFGLGAQRRAIERNDLPQVQAELAAYLQAVRSKSSVESIFSVTSTAQIVPKEEIGANGDYNFSGERYRAGVADVGRWPMVALEAVVTIESGSRQKGGAIDAGIASIGGEQIDEKGEIRFDKMKYISEEHFQGMTKGVLRSGDVLIVKDGATTGKTGFFGHDMTAAVNEHVFILRARESIDASYLYRCVRAEVFQDKLRPFIKGIIGGISLEFGGITIPLPPLEVQKEIVAEVEGYQKVINGARAVLDHYRPHIPVHPDWPIANLNDVVDFQEGPGILAKDFRQEGVPLIRLAGLRDGNVSLSGCNYLDPAMVEQKWSHFRLSEGDILVLTSASFGSPAVVGPETVGAIFYTGIIRFRPKALDLDVGFLKTYLGSASFLEQAESLASGAVIRHFGPTHLRQMLISVPPLATQQGIVAEIETEKALVAANRELRMG